MVELGDKLCDAAAVVAEPTGVRTLDALPIAAASTERAPVVSYDARLARAARAQGLEVVAPAADQP